MLVFNEKLKILVFKGTGSEGELDASNSGSIAWCVTMDKLMKLSVPLLLFVE